MSRPDTRNSEAKILSPRNDAEGELAIFEALFEHAPVGFALVDCEFRYVRVNAALAAIDSFPAGYIGKTVSEVVPHLWSLLEPLYRRALAGETILNHDISGISPTGAAGHWLVSYYPVRHRGVVVGVGVIVNDNTARWMVEKALATRNNLYAMLSRTNQAVSHCRSSDELYREVCQFAVETGRFRFAWVGVPDGGRVKLVASAGNDQGYMDEVVITLDEDDPRSHGPTGRAAITGQSYVINDFIASPMTAPWHRNAQRVGFAASATFPLKERGSVVAVLTLYASEPGFFTDDLVATLSDIAPNLSFALDGYAQDRERKRIERERDELLARLQLQIDRMPIAYVLFDAEIRHIGWNPAAERTFGYTRDEILGKPVQFLIPPEDRPSVEAIAARLRRGDVTAHSVNRNVTKDGRLITCEWYNTPLTDAAGQFIGVLSMTMDVTERVSAERALRTSEERLRLALAAGRMGTYDWDIRTNVIVWSDTHYELFGYPPGERFPVEYQHFADRIHPDDRDTIQSAIQAAMAARTTYTNECRLLLPTGVVRWVMGSGEFHYDAAGQPIRMLGTVIDITDRKRNEAELHLRDRAIRAVSQGIVITDAGRPDNPIIYVSPGFEQLTGYAAEQVLGRNCRFLQGGDTDPAAIAAVREAVARGRGCTVELLNYRQDGSTFWNSLTISPIVDAKNRVTHFVGVQTDVTERRRLEEQFRQAQKMEAVGQLAGGVAHDFNNLLTVINGYSDLLLSQISADNPMREFLAEIYKAGERAGALTRQLLTFSRQQVLEMKVLNLNGVVSDTEKMLCRLIGEDVMLVTNLCPTLGLVRADAGQLSQILINLAVNARDAMPRGGRLTVETHNVVLDANYCRAFPDFPPGDYVLLSVSDDGCGMDEATKARIFEPFYTTKGIGQGTGLGLAIVHGIVKQSRGQIAVDSAVGRGTTFKLYFPNVSETPSTALARVDQPAIPRGSETILLVEDEEAVRGLARQVLKKCGYTVLEAANGRDALELSATHAGPIHLLVSDVVMPHLGGRALAERITAQRPDCKVLFLSGYADDAVLRHGVQEAEFEFLQKPFTPSLLAHKVRNVLKPALPA